MLAPIIAALLEHRQRKETLLHTAQELAHRASISGVVRVSYRYLALQCHGSRRTAIHHIQRLIDVGLIRNSVLSIRGNYCIGGSTHEESLGESVRNRWSHPHAGRSTELGGTAEQ